MGEIVINSNSLYFSKSGRGKKAILLFHGFGQDNSVFQKLTSGLDEYCTCYSFDLFFHGKSLYNGSDKPFEKNHLKEFLQALILENPIAEFSVIGYSIGSRFAQACVELFPNRIKEIILLAPDSISVNNWYKLATYTAVGRMIFKWIIFHPSVIYFFSDLAYKLRLIDAGLFRFVQSQINNSPNRERIYYTWVVFRKLKFNLKDLIDIVTKNNIAMMILTGSRDNVIPASKLTSLQKFSKQIILKNLNASHQTLISESIPSIKELIIK
jgi:pimeloyl-ACP methyl ester carboxylesterase